MLEDLMKAVLEGAQAQQRQQSRPQQPQTPQGGDILTDLLKGVLGGQQQPAARPKQQQVEPDMFGMADLIAGVLGVGGGGGRQAQGSNPIVNMVAGMLADKLGISPQIAMTIVSFAMAALMKRKSAAQSQPQAQGGQGLDLDDLLEGDFAWDSGLASRLAQQTGMEEDEAAYGLQEAMMLLSGQMAPAKTAKKASRPARKAAAQPAASTRKGGLDHLLDTWKTG